MGPNVQQNAPPPTGNVPRGRQMYIMLAAALAIVLAVVFTPSSTTSTARTADPKLSPNTPNRAEIDRYMAQIKLEDDRLKQAQDEAARAHAAYQQYAPVPVQGGIPGQHDAYPYPTNSQVPPKPEKSAIEQEQERREYQSLFASNVALSLRPTPPEGAQTQAQTKPAVAPALTTGSTAGTNRDQKTYTLLEGTIIPTTLTNRLDGSFTGPVNCQVTADMWSRDHQHLLIPQGSRVLGECHRVDEQQQERLAIVFHRMVMPDGYSVNLDKLEGLDQAGAAAVADKVNHHYLSLFGTSLALGVLSGFSIYGTGNGFTGTGADVYRQGIASQMSQSSTRILDRQLSRLPTITIREGQRVNVFLSKDLELPDVRDHGKELP